MVELIQESERKHLVFEPSNSWEACEKLSNTTGLTRCVPIVPCKQTSVWEMYVPILLAMRSHVSVILDFQLSLSVWMHLSGRGNISNNSSS